MNLKTALELLEIIDQQNTLIAQLVNESCEQEAIIETLMQESIQLSEYLPPYFKAQLRNTPFEPRRSYGGNTISPGPREKRDDPDIRAACGSTKERNLH